VALKSQFLARIGTSTIGSLASPSAESAARQYFY
jgi:hypothetical protein